jgi:Phage tail assembly chaperone proteins, E, or 41 or 14
MADEVKKENGVEFTGLIVPLSKEVNAHGEMIKELRFREPTGADIEAVGSPIRIDFYGTEPKMRYETESMSAMMSRLATVPPSTIKMITARDWESAALQLAHRFFIPVL